MIFIICYGLVMIYSASVYKIDSEKGVTAIYYVRRQAFYAVIGLAGVWFTQNVLKPVHLYKLSELIYLTGVVATCLLHWIGSEKYGAKRWIQVGPVTVQVAEIVKIGVILMIAACLEKSREEGTVYRLLLYWALGFVPAGFVIVISKDLGSGLVIAGIAFVMTFIYTDEKKCHAGLLALGLAGGAGFVFYVKKTLPPEEMIHIGHGHIYQRIAAWLNKDGYLKTVSSQLRESQYAISRGGLFGCGLGRSIQKLGRIPEVHTDMILAVVGEELGVCGLALYVFLILYMVNLIFKAAYREKDLFMSVVDVGIGTHIFLQAFINMAVVFGVIPNTGITAPFMSYGGTSLVLFMLEVGVVLCGEKSRNRREMKKQTS